MKMQCCVPFCNNTSENASTSEEISFHGFPSEEHLHAAWLHALGKQESLLPHSAVVCSQHFLSDDFYKTGSGSRQVVYGAIPSTVQVCMICLDTGSKLFLMSTHKLEEAYELLTEYPLYDPGNLKHILCAECVQRLMNFRKFRDKSLRARALMMDLVEKHELITRRHIELIDRTKYRLKSDMVLTTLATDHCDLHIVEHPSQDRLAELEPAGDGVIVKTEETEVSMLDDEDGEINENGYNLDQDFFKHESSPFQYPLCLEESVHEHEDKQRLGIHLQRGAADGECATSQECERRAAASSTRHMTSPAAKHKQCAQTPSGAPGPPSACAAPASVAQGEADTDHRRQPAEGIPKCESDQSSVRNYITNTNVNIFTNCVVKLYDIFSNSRRDSSSRDQLLPRSSSVRHHIASTDRSHQPTSRNTLPSSESFEKDEPNPVFTCDSWRKSFRQKRLLVKHIESHAAVNRFTCNICQYSCRYKYLFLEHRKIHTSEKPYACNLCEYKTSRTDTFKRHMRKHTDEKPFSCCLCEYKSIQKENVANHMRIHTDEKPFSCKLCKYKSNFKGNLTRHMRTHTGEKPFSCHLREYKSAKKDTLISHIRTHRGEKSFSCKFCE